MNSPAEIASNYIGIAQAKASQRWYKTLILAVLAGVFIALGGALATVAGSAISGTAGVLVKGAVFPLGLILVVLCGAELFTGNCLLLSPTVERKISVGALFKNWGIVYSGNLIGSVLVAVLVVYSHVLGDGGASATVATAAAKCNLNFGDAFVRGILCNMLVCLAVWSAMASKSAAGKVLAVYLPVFAFVVLGFEHSVANMYYLSSGLIAGAEYGLTAAGLNLGNALLFDLLPSTLGNIIGGCAIAMAYFTVCRFGLNKQKAKTAVDEKSLDDNKTE